MMDLVFTFHIPSKIGSLLCVVYLMTLLITVPIALNDWMMPGRNGEITKKPQAGQSVYVAGSWACVFGYITQVHSWCHCSASCMVSVYLDEEIQVRKCINLVILMKFTVGNSIICCAVTLVVVL